MDNWLRCKLTQGQFSGELAVRGMAHDGSEFSLFVEESQTCTHGSLTGDREVDGLVRVEILQSEGDLRLIRLPGQTFENGRTVTVRASQIEKRRSRQEA